MGTDAAEQPSVESVNRVSKIAENKSVVFSGSDSGAIEDSNRKPRRIAAVRRAADSGVLAKSNFRARGPAPPPGRRRHLNRNQGLKPQVAVGSSGWKNRKQLWAFGITCGKHALRAGLRDGAEDTRPYGLVSYSLRKWAAWEQPSLGGRTIPQCECEKPQAGGPGFPAEWAWTWTRRTRARCGSAHATDGGLAGADAGGVGEGA
jgi:hypothetical protein